MRSFHRICGIFAVLVMLYLGGTGTLMQLIDLKTLLSHAPQTDATMQSIEEGMNGNGSFPVISLWDMTASSLPSNLDYMRAIAQVLSGMRRAVPNAAPSYVELRQINSVPVGQVRLGTELKAFSAETGDPVAAVDAKPTPLPPSLREKTKRLHRFWDRHDTPGVYFELLSGLTLWVLLITGLVMYFRLLRTRARQGRRQLFWMAGGWWRGTHRVVSVASAFFLIAIAFSGTWLGFESVYHSLHMPNVPQVKRAGTASPPEDNAARLTDAEVQQMATATLTALKRTKPDAAIKVLRVRMYGSMRQGVVVLDGPLTTQVVFNTDTGKQATLYDPAYPDGGFPFGTQMHEDIKHFHSGAMFGLTARFMNLIAGLSLLFLSISGIEMYVAMWLKRRITGRGNIVWL